MLNHNSYLGEKGFTILKEDLGIKDQQFLREKLSVKPFIPKSPIQPEAFPVYRESQKKFYIPIRYPLPSPPRLARLVNLFPEYQ